MKSITVGNWTRIPENYTGHVQYTHGAQEWLVDGKYHREDGPAIIWCDESYYWLNDRKYSKDDYYRELYKRGKITEQELFIELL